MQTLSKPSLKTMHSIDQQLQQRSKKELILLIKAMIARQPNLQVLLELPLAGSQSAQKRLDPEPIRRQLQTAFYGADEWGSSMDVACELESILNMAGPFREAGDWTNVKTICQLVLQEALVNYQYVGHDEGEVVAEINHAAAQLADCLAAFAGDSESRADILGDLFGLVCWDIEMGGYGAADGITDVLRTKTDADEKQLLREWIMLELGKTDKLEEFSRQWQREHWGSLLLPLIDEAGFDDFLPQARSMGLHRSLFGKFVQLGRIDEAVNIALEDTEASNYSLLQSAQQLEKAGHLESAVGMVETRVAQITDERLLVWLAEKREQAGNIQGAMNLHLKCWDKKPALPGYQTLERLAGKLGEWDTLRTKLVGGLMESNRDLEALARIRLYEKAWDAAWAVVGEKASGNWHDTIRNEVAQATAQHCPQQVMTYYLSKAQQLIKQRGRDNYASAAGYLKNVKKILNRMGQKATWQQTINQIRQNHANLPALRDELNKAGLL